MANMERLEAIVDQLPEAVRVDIEAWGGEPTFRVGGKNFIFAAPDRSSISVKLPLEESAAVVASDPFTAPTGYGLGRPRLGPVSASRACRSSGSDGRRWSSGSVSPTPLSPPSVWPGSSWNRTPAPLTLPGLGLSLPMMVPRPDGLGDPTGWRHGCRNVPIVEGWFTVDDPPTLLGRGVPSV